VYSRAWWVGVSFGLVSKPLAGGQNMTQVNASKPAIDTNKPNARKAAIDTDKLRRQTKKPL
jgi:hypothetical protein